MKICTKCQKHFSDDANFCPVDAARLLPLDAAQGAGTDTLAARFDVGEKIGGGRTGAVHRATEKVGGKAVVIKLVAPAVTALPGVAQRLERELKQLERIQSAGVTKLIASGKRDDQTWLALEPLADAHTLADAISARGPIDLAGAAQLIEVIGEALIEAAQVGVVHRDLAPKNVLFAGDQVKLINFSLPVPTSDKVPGVAEFVAPEQVDGKPVDQRGNLYSLGALYYYVLTGQPPFTGDTATVHAGHTSGTIKPPSQLAAVPAPIEAVIMRALDRSPTKRFLTVRQFVDEVSRVGRGEQDMRSTMPMGKAGVKKAELVQTLLGVRSGGGYVAAPASTGGSAPVSVPAAAPVAAAAAPPVVAANPITTAPTVATPAVVSPAPAMVVATPASALPTMVAPAAVAATTPGASERSPWAAKDQAAAPAPTAAAAPVVAAPVVAAPVVAAAVAAAPAAAAAPVVAAPVVAAPVVAPAAAGKKKAPAGDDGDGAKKGKFRETMWFKKGEMDSAAANAAAEQRAATGRDVASDKADSLPMDERYKDDGSISRGDKEKYSLRTGGTQTLRAVTADEAAMSHRVSEGALIEEMKRGRRKVLFMIAAAVVAIGALIALLVAR